MTEPLFECDRARIDVGGRPVVEGLSLATKSERVALVGDVAFVFRLLSGEAALSSGSVRLMGVDAREAVITARVGLALFDPPMPDDWTALDYLTTSAALLGHSRTDAARSARRALDELAIESLARRRLGTLDAPSRRAVLFAHATLGGPQALALERPFEGLPPPSLPWARRLIETLATERRLLISVSSVPPVGDERHLIESAGEVVVFHGGSLVAQGPFEDVFKAGRRYAVTGARRAGELVQALERAGMVVADTGGREQPSALDSRRLVVLLPAGESPARIVAAADELGVALLELVPLPAAEEKTPSA